MRISVGAGVIRNDGGFSRGFQVLVFRLQLSSRTDLRQANDWKKASKRSKAPVAADIEIASRSRDEEAFRRSRLDLHCIRETGASFPGFIIGLVKPSNQPCWDFSFPLVSKAESAIRIKRTWSSGIAWIRRVIGNVFRCFTTSFAACTCSMVGLVSDDASIEAAEKASGLPPRDTQLKEAIRPRNCVFSLSDSCVLAACFLSTFLWPRIGSSLV